MAVSLCKCSSAIVIGRNKGHGPDDIRVAPLIVESSLPRLTPAISPAQATQNKDNSIAIVRSRYARWVSLAAAGAASVSVLSATPRVLAGEWEVHNDMITHSVPGDLSLNIAIPIPDSETWSYGRYGFLAPPPGPRREISVLSNYQGGCPAWQPSQFEMIVPDGVHPKQNPRHGGQWPALYMLEEATIENPAYNSTDPGVKYASLIDALLRMSDAGLTCFSL